MDRATRKMEARLDPHLEDGEFIEVWDVAKIRGQRGGVPCAASNRALYLIGPSILRIGYDEVLTTRGGPKWLGLQTVDGSDLVLDWGVTPKGISEVVVDYYRKAAQQRKRIHVSWASNGITVLVKLTGPDRGVMQWQYDKDPVDDIGMMQTMTADQALGELELVLGLQPSGVHTDPRPDFMGDFSWDPPLSSLSEA